MDPVGSTTAYGARLSDCALRYGTPLFCYDGAEIRGTWQRLRKLLPADVEILYSIKANPNPDVCRLLRDLGGGAEIASLGELAAAREARFRPSAIAVSGPAKTPAELHGYLGAGVGVIHAESLPELLQIEAVAAQMRVQAAVALRINPAAAVSGARIRMGGHPAQFGIDESEVGAVLDRARDLEHVDVVGAHVYCGTQILDAAQLTASHQEIGRIARQVARLLGRPLRYLNFGGGFGVPFSPGDPTLEIEPVCSHFTELCADLRRCPELRQTRFLLELGRYLTAPAGSFLCTVLDVKASGGKRFVILDGGIHCHFSLSPLFRFHRSNPQLSVIRRRPPLALETVKVDLVGPLCTSLDCLARNVEMVLPQPGDLVVFPNAGAYGLTLSPVLFLSRGLPPEVFLAEDGEARVTRLELRRETESELELRAEAGGGR